MNKQVDMQWRFTKLMMKLLRLPKKRHTTGAYFTVYKRDGKWQARPCEGCYMRLFSALVDPFYGPFNAGIISMEIRKLNTYLQRLNGVPVVEVSNA